MHMYPHIYPIIYTLQKPCKTAHPNNLNLNINLSTPKPGLSTPEPPKL